ncbi:ComEC/Rec2 family competence protein [Flavivirga spongiicola]|uniref:ComEC family competence protein n=1 Tax=Flavivirga spongiicola TaxID=421621 RepID=A0ABU7XVK3_9FLAO|nr:ComEC/Rec2 family competence protein [Flavivirga sp. MEBiC05379]MDO5979811.1 ComEC/Rec2 family competence protein [Flavivirga sp. MEBiC05379]
MQLLNFTIIKLTTYFIIGIAISTLFSIPLNVSLYLTASLFVILLVFYLIAKRQFIKTSWFGLSSFLMMISIGILTTNLHNEKNYSNHYTNQVSIKNDSLKTMTFRIRDVLKSGNFYDKYVIDLLEIDGSKVKGKSLLNIEKGSTQIALKIDDIFISKTVFKDLNQPLNPHQFNYKTYLEKKYIYQQLFISNRSLLKVSSKTHSLLGLASNIREYINLKLKSHLFKPDELAIINALLLGQRQDISKTIYSNYTNAGAIHILAVSGLHVGIILIILSFVLKPIESFKHGKLIKTFLLVVILWCFALIAGLSASVTRAVTMFSIVAIAINLKRPTNIYNTLAISIFTILLFKPMFLFDVGFQLSYLAVFAIVIVDPVIYKRWKPKSKIIDFYWHTFTVTLSAQLGIIPISLYYFHQFPSLFFISNLVIIPFLGFILGLGILIILLAVLNLLPQFIATIYGHIIGLMNDFIAWISRQELFLIKDIPFDLLYALASYLSIIYLIKLLKKWHYYNLKYLLITIVIFQSIVIYTNYNIQTNAFIIFHKNKHSLIGNITHNKMIVAHDFDTLPKTKNNIVRDYAVGNHINIIEKDSLQSVYLLNNKRFLVIDSLGVYNIKSFEPDYLLLRQSPKINLNRLIDSIKPKYVIADGSNYKSYMEKWEIICKKRELPFHQTSKKGAFIIEY